GVIESGSAISLLVAGLHEARVAVEAICLNSGGPRETMLQPCCDEFVAGVGNAFSSELYAVATWMFQPSSPGCLRFRGVVTPQHHEGQRRRDIQAIVGQLPRPAQADRAKVCS